MLTQILHPSYNCFARRKTIENNGPCSDITVITAFRQSSERLINYEQRLGITTRPAVDSEDFLRTVRRMVEDELNLARKQLRVSVGTLHGLYQEVDRRPAGTRPSR